MLSTSEAIEIRPNVGTISQVGVDRLERPAQLEVLRDEGLPDAASVFVVEVQERAVGQVKAVAYPMGQGSTVCEVAGADAEGVGACRRQLG